MNDNIPLQFGEFGILNVPKKIGIYEYIKTIGFGSFSVVILVKNIKTNVFFACKVVSRDMLEKEKIFDRFEQETRTLQILDHPNIVKLFDIIYQKTFFFLILEYCRNGELFKYIITRGYLSEKEVLQLFTQILKAISYIHSKNIVHRDIKPENILLDQDMNIKLADFGLCRTMKSCSLLKTPCGSPFYAPPEIIDNEDYDGKKSDIWSLGVVLFTMSTGTLPWTESNQTQLFLQISKADISFPSNISPPLISILQSMLNRNPLNRLSANELLENPFLHELNLNEIKPTRLKKHFFF